MLVSYKASHFAAHSFYVIWGRQTVIVLDVCGDLLLEIDNLSAEQFAQLRLKLSWSQSSQLNAPCPLSTQQFADLVGLLRTISTALSGLLMELAAMLPTPTVFNPTRAPVRLKWYQAITYPHR